MKRKTKPFFHLLLIIGILLKMGAYEMAAQSKLEEKIGKTTLASVEASYGFYENPPLLDYVKSIGRKLEATLPDPPPYKFQYFLVDTPEPNAFATAGGYVFVNRGLFPILDTEDELAGILGHEFTHVLLHHSTKKMRRNILPAILEIPGNLLGTLHSELLGDLLNMPIELTSKTADAAFSRKQEKAADTYGIQIATRAGYDPAGLQSALLKLETFVEGRYGVEEHFTLFLDHPLTEDRVEHLNELRKEYEMQSRKPIPLGHHMDGIILGQNPAQGLIFPDNTFAHPDLDLYLKFPKTWELENNPSALTAADKSGLSGFALGVESNSTRIDSAAYKLASKFEQSAYKVEMGEVYQLNGLEAINLLVTGDNIRRDGITSFTWIQLEDPGIILHCMGSAHSEEQFSEIVQIISSIRRLEPGDKEKIVRHTLHVEVGGDRTLEEFARMKGRGVIENLELTALINELDPADNILGKRIKYIRTERYLP